MNLLVASRVCAPLRIQAVAAALRQGGRRDMERESACISRARCAWTRARFARVQGIPGTRLPLNDWPSSRARCLVEASADGR